VRSGNLVNVLWVAGEVTACRGDWPGAEEYAAFSQAIDPEPNRFEQSENWYRPTRGPFENRISVNLGVPPAGAKTLNLRVEIHRRRDGGLGRDHLDPVDWRCRAHDHTDG